VTTLPLTPVEPSHKSTFVTVVAWIAIVFSALATLGALLTVFALAVTPAGTVNAAVNQVAQDTAFTRILPAPYLFMLHHVRLIAFIKLAWWATALIASIGVLRRQEWARQVFVAVLGIEILAVAFGVIMGQLIGMALASQIASTSRSGQVPPGMGSGLAFAGLLGVAIIGILVWLLFMFRSAHVREEFAGRAA
jgi:hypothetical protein